MAQTPVTPAFIAIEPRNGVTDLSRSVNLIDPTPGNQLVQYHEGLYVAASTGGGTGTETPLTVTDSSTIDLTPGATGNGHTGLTAVVKLSATAGNTIVANADGLYVPAPTCAQVKAALESTGCVIAGTVATVLAFDTAGKLIKGTIAAAAETPLTVTDSTTVDLTPGATGNGHTGLTASVIISPDTGNLLVAKTNGLFANITCTTLTTFLMNTTCIPITNEFNNVGMTAPALQTGDVLDTAFGVDYDGRLVRGRRRRKVALQMRGDDQQTTIEATNTVTFLATPANRMVHRWREVGLDSSFNTGDIVYPASNIQVVTFVHAAHYIIRASVYMRLKMLAAEAVNGRSYSLISAFLPNVGGVPQELRFGEDTIEANTNSTAALVGAGWDVVHAGVIGPMWFGAGDTIYIRSWVAGGNAASNAATVTIKSVTVSGTTFSIEEVLVDLF